MVRHSRSFNSLKIVSLIKQPLPTHAQVSKGRFNVSLLTYKLSRGEICVANLIPPANGASLGSYFCVKNLDSA